MKLVFGISKSQIGRVTVFGVCLSSLLLVVGIPVGITHGTIHSLTDVLPDIGWIVAIGAVVPICVGVAGLLRFRIEDDEIYQMLGPWPIAKRRLQELKSVSFKAGLFPVILQFSDSTRFRLLALHLHDRGRLAKYLQARVPGLEMD